MQNFLKNSRNFIKKIHPKIQAAKVNKIPETQFLEKKNRKEGLVPEKERRLPPDCRFVIIVLKKKDLKIWGKYSTHRTFRRLSKKSCKKTLGQYVGPHARSHSFQKHLFGKSLESY